MNMQRKLEDYRSGALCALVANALAGSKSRTFRPSDFFPSLKSADENRQSPQSMIAIAEMITVMQNARIGEA
jgi:hypothetical protein